MAMSDDVTGLRIGFGFMPRRRPTPTGIRSRPPAVPGDHVAEIADDL